MSHLAWIRQYYGVPAWRGVKVRFSGVGGESITGRIMSGVGGKLWIRLDRDGTRFGPLHPTWEMEYINDVEQAVQATDKID
jgi:hypothetical protein